MKFDLPITRKNPLTLEEIAKSCVAKHYTNSLDQLNLPKNIKESFEEHHNHFCVTIDGKKAYQTEGDWTLYVHENSAAKNIIANHRDCDCDEQ